MSISGRAKEKILKEKLIYFDPLTNAKDFNENWIVQQIDMKGVQPLYEVKKNGLHVYATGGTTIWLKKKLRSPICIIYTVKMDLKKMNSKLLKAWRKNPKSIKYGDVVPSDVNSFYLADDLYGDSVLNSKLYTGRFKDYHLMGGYYGSVGGGSGTTTRARRYPRFNKDKKDISHPFWDHQDNQDGALITADKEQTIQCIAINGFIQYMLDEKVIYEYDYGDTIKTTSDNGKTFNQDTYTREKYPPYYEGYFGIRLVRSAHIYKNITIYSLN